MRSVAALILALLIYTDPFVSSLIMRDSFKSVNLRRDGARLFNDTDTLQTSPTSNILMAKRANQTDLPISIANDPILQLIRTWIPSDSSLCRKMYAREFKNSLRKSIASKIMDFLRRRGFSASEGLRFKDKHDRTVYDPPVYSDIVISGSLNPVYKVPDLKAIIKLSWNIMVSNPTARDWCALLLWEYKRFDTSDIFESGVDEYTVYIIGISPGIRIKQYQIDKVEKERKVTLLPNVQVPIQQAMEGWQEVCPLFENAYVPEGRSPKGQGYVISWRRLVVSKGRTFEANKEKVANTLEAPRSDT